MYQDPHSHIRPLSHAFTLNSDGARHGVLLLHGFADTPYSMRDLALFLHRHGYFVLVPRLPGHGTRKSDFIKTTLQDWRQCVRRALDGLQRHVERLTIVGRSFGGVLALLELVERPRAADQLILLATPAFLRRDKWLSVVLPPLKSIVREIRKPWVARDELLMRMEIGRYPTLPVASLLEFLRGMRQMDASALERITTPTLIVHGKDDVVSSPKSALAFFERLSRAEKELVWLDATTHLPTSMHQNPVFQRKILEFLASS